MDLHFDVFVVRLLVGERRILRRMRCCDAHAIHAILKAVGLGIVKRSRLVVAIFQF